MTTRLGVNIDHVATLRQVRRAAYPDPVIVAAMAELGGAHQITLHLREDRRHIQDRDLKILRDTVKTGINLEMAATPELVKIAYEIRPNVSTLVPERREELTTEGGLDVVALRDNIRKVVRTLRDAEIEVSLFIDPDLEQVRAAHKCDATRIELHTGRYADAHKPDARTQELVRLEDCARVAAKLGLKVAAGHGLNYGNVEPIARIAELEELNIGHAIVARAMLVGMERAVREMLERMRSASL